MHEHVDVIWQTENQHAFDFQLSNGPQLRDEVQKSFIKIVPHSCDFSLAGRKYSKWNGKKQTVNDSKMVIWHIHLWVYINICS